MPVTASAAKPALTGYRTLLATLEAAGTPWHITPNASVAERIAHPRRVAADHLHNARTDTTKLYAIVRRHTGDRRWGWVDLNPEARPVLRSIRQSICAARDALWAAEELEGLLEQVRLAA